MYLTQLHQQRKVHLKTKRPKAERIGVMDMTARFAFAFVATFAYAAFAADVVWIGNDGGYWEAGANWEGGRKPGSGDTAVFNPGDGNVLNVISVGYDSEQGFSYSACRGFRFLSGETTIHVAKNQIYLNNSGAETEIFVDEQATGTISNNIVTGLYLTDNSTKPLLVKRGKGVFNKCGSNWFEGYGICPTTFAVEDGTVNMFNTLCPSGTGSALSTISNVLVKSGAALNYRHQSRLSSVATLELENGSLLRLSNGASVQCEKIVGGGEISLADNGTSAGKVLGTGTDLSGWTGTLRVEVPNVTYGDSTTAGWISLNPEAWMICSPTGITSFAAPADGGTVISNGVYSRGAVHVRGGSLEFRNLDLDGRAVNNLSTLMVDSPLRISGGSLRIGGYGLYLRQGSQFSVSGAYVAGGDVAYYGKVRHPVGFYINENNNAARLFEAEDGATVVMSGRYAITNRFSGCTVIQTSSVAYPDKGDVVATEDSPAVARFDDAKLVYSGRSAGFVYGVRATTPKLRMQVGEKGLHIDFDSQDWYADCANYRWCFSAPFETASDVERDGGVLVTGGGFLDVATPWLIKGLFDCQDGVLRIYNRSSDWVEAPTQAIGTTLPMFGAGDMRMGSAKFIVLGVEDKMTVRLGTGGKFRFNGAATLATSDYTSPTSTAHNFELGEIVAEDGGALFIVDKHDTMDGTVKSAVAPAQTADGRVVAPVIVSTAKTLSFASYDAELGFRKFSGYVEGLGGGANSTAIVSSGPITLASDATVAALKVNGCHPHETNGDAGVVTIADGTRLTIGNGIGVPTLLMENGQYTSAAHIAGDGTLAFAGGKGLVVVSQPSNGLWPSRISAKIASDNAITVMAPLNDEWGNALDMVGEQSYSGGTTVKGAIVRPCGDSSLGVGEVYLANGELGGGGLWMGTRGVKISNRIKAAGWGTRLRIRSKLSLGDSRGAITFTEDGEISGDVEAYAPLRISAIGDGVSGLVSGEISGDRVQVWNTTNAVGVSEIVFSGANSYTGGTEVVRSVLKIEADGTVGTGDVMLDDGTLVFSNGKEDVSLTNRICGVGVVRLTGRGMVTLGAVDGQDGTGLALDVRRGTTQVSSLSGFASISAPSAGFARIVVGDDNISFDGAICGNVTLVKRSEWHERGFVIGIR